MEIESLSHEALRRFVGTGKPKGLPGDLVDRLVKMVNFIVDAETLGELSTPPNYGLRPLTGDRAGTWAMTVTRNWRLAFSMNEQGPSQTWIWRIITDGYQGSSLVRDPCR